jgi:hypothetical protein
MHAPGFRVQTPAQPRRRPGHHHRTTVAFSGKDGAAPVPLQQCRASVHAHACMSPRARAVAKESDAAAGCCCCLLAGHRHRLDSPGLVRHTPPRHRTRRTARGATGGWAPNQPTPRSTAERPSRPMARQRVGTAAAQQIR